MERFSPQLYKSAWAVLAFLTVSGCQQFGRPSTPSGLSGGFDMPSAKLKPEQAADVQVALAHSLEMHGAIGQALAMYEEAVKKDPHRSDAWLRMAILHDQQGQFAESASLYQKALAAQPGSADIYCDMGYSLYLQQHWAEAEMNLRQALALRPDHARAHNNLGLVLGRACQAEGALDEFHKAGCSDADAQANLAFALTLERHWPEALQHYQQALQADPYSAPAKKGLQELEQLLARMNPPATGTPILASGSPFTQTSETTSSAPDPSIPAPSLVASPDTRPIPGAPSPSGTFAQR
jgi:tetratricopeptide (TPR) repeat protein